MRDDAPYLSAEQVRGYLAEVGAELAAAGASAQVYVVGGSAMALSGILERRLTQDVDVVVESGKAEVFAASAVVAARHGLDPSWLNDRVSAFAAQPSVDAAASTSHLDALVVRVAGPRNLLAMKLDAARAKDVDDITALVAAAGVSSEQEVADLLREVFGNRVGAGPPEGVDVEDLVLYAGAFLRRGRSPTLTPPAMVAPSAPCAPPVAARCGHWMRRAGRVCLLPLGHRAQHR